MKINVKDITEDNNITNFNDMAALAYDIVENQLKAPLHIDFDVRKAGHINQRPDKDPSREEWIEVMWQKQADERTRYCPYILAHLWGYSDATITG